MEVVTDEAGGGVEYFKLGFRRLNMRFNSFYMIVLVTLRSTLAEIASTLTLHQILFFFIPIKNLSYFSFTPARH